jgi:4-amino-4-deoxy-L-arabinose transferase-like glycosyltransferase
LAIALFSLLSGTGVYIIGKALGGYRIGLLALGLYALLPLASFYERMTLADPFAAAFMGLVAWRSLVFVRRPIYREGILLGILLSACLLAKLTMGLIPLLPVAASLIYWNGGFSRNGLMLWARIYLAPLFIAAGIVVLAWLPTLIPAALAINSDNPFTLVNAYNLQYINESDPVGTLSEILPMLASYTHIGLLLGILVGLVYLLWRRDTRRYALFLLVWMLLVVLLSLAAAAEIRIRYYMPLALPAVLILAYAARMLWLEKNSLLRVALMVAGLLWMLGFALPFTITMLDNPADLSLSEGDWVRYLSGNFSGEALRNAATTLNELDTPPDKIYSTWGTCQLLYLYTKYEVSCLPPVDEATSPYVVLMEELAGVNGKQVYLVLNRDEPTFEAIDGESWQAIATFSRPHIDRPMIIWRMKE